MRADGCKEFGLFDGIDAQICFQVEVQIEHLGRVAGLLADRREHESLDLLCIGGTGCNWLRGYSNGASSRRLRDRKWQAGRGARSGCRFRRPQGGTLSKLPAGGGWLLGWYALVLNMQGALGNFEFSGWIAGDLREPMIIGGVIHPLALSGDPAQQDHGDL